MRLRRPRWIVLASALTLVLVSLGPMLATERSAMTDDSDVQQALTSPVDVPPLVGVNYHGLWWDMTPSRRAAVLDKLAATGAGWVRLDVSWAMLQPQGPDRFDDE